jgi:hypothetical protein
MANRIGTFPTFANLAPPWSLPTLDANFVSVNTAFNDSSLGFVNATATDTGTANNYVVTLPFGTPSTYNQGMTVAFVPLNSNTGSSNITVNPLGSVSILDASGNALATGAMTAGALVTMVFVGTAFRLITSSAGGRLVYTNNVTASPPVTITINCLGFSSVSVYISLKAAANGTFTFALTNLAAGTPIDILINVNTISQIAKWTASTPSAIAYTAISAIYGFDNAPPGGNFNVNLITTGDSASNFIQYRGVANLDPNSSNNVIHFIAASF